MSSARGAMQWLTHLTFMARERRTQRLGGRAPVPERVQTATRFPTHSSPRVASTHYSVSRAISRVAINERGESRGSDL